MRACLCLPLRLTTLEIFLSVLLRPRNPQLAGARIDQGAIRSQSAALDFCCQSASSKLLFSRTSFNIENLVVYVLRGSRRYMWRRSSSQYKNPELPLLWFCAEEIFLAATMGSSREEISYARRGDGKALTFRPRVVLRGEKLRTDIDPIRQRGK